MHLNKKIIAFIPARGGSKAIKNKNLQKINKSTLIEITLKKVIASKIFDKIILSSDSDKILKIGKKIKNVQSVKRRKKISKDNSKTDLAVIDYLKNLQENFNYLVILQVTSPLRRISTIRKFVRYCVRKKLKNCLSVSKFNDHISFNKKYFRTELKNNSRRRQSRKDYYIENGMFYFLDINYFRKKKKISSNKWNYYVTNKYESIDINDYEDLFITKLIYNKF